MAQLWTIVDVLFFDSRDSYDYDYYSTDSKYCVCLFACRVVW